MPYYHGRWHLYDERERREYGERKRQERSQQWHAIWISRQGLKTRLWTDKAIATFLPLPQKAGPILAWRKKDVLAAEKKPRLSGLDSKTADVARRALPVAGDHLRHLWSAGDWLGPPRPGQTGPLPVAGLE